MSASKEKQIRQEQANAGTTDPKTAREERQRKEEKRSNTLYAIIGALFLIALVITLVWRSNIIAKSATALTIDGEKYTASEVNFYYWNSYNNFLSQYSYLISYLGLDTTVSPAGQAMNETAAGMLGAEAGTTWKDYFLDQAQQQMAAIQNTLKKAEAEGYTFTDSVQAQYEDTLESITTSANASGASLGDYLKNAYGSLMTEKVFKAQLLRTAQYSDYLTSYRNGLTYTTDEITAAYEADPNSYDFVSYESVSVLGSAETTTDADGNPVEPTEEESAAALEAAKATADQILADYKDGQDLETLASNADRATYSSNEEAAYFTSDLGQWLFDSSRQEGDSTIVESGTTYYVAVFHQRFRKEEPTVSVRHILVGLASGEKAQGDEGYEEEQAQLKADAKAKAEELLAQWQSGDATEAGFAALAMKETADGGSKYSGGLYPNVYKGQMVTEFNDWCFDPARKSGDTGIVETTYGAHVMYFVGESLPYWQYDVSSDLQTADFNEWLDAMPAESTITPSSFGMQFVG